MTSPLHGEDPGFKSPWAHFSTLGDTQKEVTFVSVTMELFKNDSSLYGLEPSSE